MSSSITLGPEDLQLLVGLQLAQPVDEEDSEAGRLLVGSTLGPGRLPVTLSRRCLPHRAESHWDVLYTALVSNLASQFLCCLAYFPRGLLLSSGSPNELPAE